MRFEDEHLLAVAKPAGVNTHRADEHAQDGMHEWVQRQRPTARLSVLHRLDKVTSGLLLFGKTSEANRALAAQFAARRITKRYELIVGRDDQRPPALASRSPIDGDDATTELNRVQTGRALERWDAHPRTGRTHQVRLHATDVGAPILGDVDHGGAPAARVFLHAADLTIDHPDGRPRTLRAERPPSFDRVVAGADPTDPAVAAAVAHEARALLFDPRDTNAYVWIDRHHDGFPGTRVERLGDVALVHRYDAAPLPTGWLEGIEAATSPSAVYEHHHPKGGGGQLARLVAGAATGRFTVTELGVRYHVDLTASTTSSGLFLDQRETRRELLGRHLQGRTVLNAFAHTGSLSVAAALAGAETLTLDLSRHYLEWATENLRANGLDPADHDFVYGDAMDWLDRFAKKGRTFNVVLLDPPSSSTSRGKHARRWVADRDLHDLVARAARVVAPAGTLFVSTNLRRMPWAAFLDQLERGLGAARRHGSVETRTLPLDHRSGPGDRPYLKAAWIALDD